MILSDGFEVLWHQAGATSQSFDLEFYGSCQSMNSKRLQQGRPNLALHLCGNCHNLSHLRVLGCYNDARQEGPSTKNLWVQTGCLDWVGLLDMCTATIWWVHDSQGIRESTLHHFATEHGPSMAGYSHIVRAGEKFTPIHVVLVGPTLDDSYRYLAWVRIQKGTLCGAASIIQTIRNRNCSYHSRCMFVWDCTSVAILPSSNLRWSSWINLWVRQGSWNCSMVAEEQPLRFIRAHWRRYCIWKCKSQRHAPISEHVKLLMESPAPTSFNLLCSMDFVATSCHSTW